MGSAMPSEALLAADLPPDTPDADFAESVGEICRSRETDWWNGNSRFTTRPPIGGFFTFRSLENGQIAYRAWHSRRSLEDHWRGKGCHLSHQCGSRGRHLCRMLWRRVLSASSPT